MLEGLRHCLRTPLLEGMGHPNNSLNRLAAAPCEMLSGSWEPHTGNFPATYFTKWLNLPNDIFYEMTTLPTDGLLNDSWLINSLRNDVVSKRCIYFLSWRTDMFISWVDELTVFIYWLTKWHLSYWVDKLTHMDRNPSIFPSFVLTDTARADDAAKRTRAKILRFILTSIQERSNKMTWQQTMQVVREPTTVQDCAEVFC